MIRIAVPPHWASTVAIVRDVGDAELDRWFTADEQEKLRSFAREKRRAEWSSSRVAAKLLALERGLCPEPHQCVVASAYRRPHLSLSGSPSELHVTITHSEGAGGAGIDPARIGIDLQKVRPLAERATKFFLSDDEVAAWRSTSVADGLIHFWCAKEAGYKLHARRGWYKGVRIRVIGERDDGVDLEYEDAASSGTIETRTLADGFVLALARMTSSKSN